MKIISLFAMFCFLFSSVFGEIHHHYVEQNSIEDNAYQWELRETNPFDELLISWNSRRPLKGHYAIYVSVDTGVWSPWLPYAEWGKNYQKSFSSKKEGVPVRVYQDTVQIFNGKKGRGFRVKVIGENGANLSKLKYLHVCSSNPNSLTNKKKYYSRSSTLLKIEGLSQMELKDPRNYDLCSPSSTTAIVRFLNKDNSLDPIQFAKSCWDSGFDIFGNWVFNVTEAYNRLINSDYLCWAERYENFQIILDSLDRGFPVVISVQGPLPGSAQPYKLGHILVIIGFTEKT